MTDARTSRTRQPMQYVALIYGVVFLLVGILGFILGITTDYDSLQFAGHESEAMLLGIFQVSWLHFGLAVTMVILSFLRTRSAPGTTRGSAARTA